MEYRKLEGEFPKLTKSAVTLGKFDGVHRGHKKLIDQILERKKYGEKAVVVAFISERPTILTSEERRHYLESLGVDVLLECPLTKKFCYMNAEDFVEHVLVERLDTKFVAVGEDYHFGFGKKGNVKLLKKMGEHAGYQTVIVKKEMNGRCKVSSTYIREELSLGHMEKVEELLGRPFVVEGIVEHGRGMGRKNFFPTANLVPSERKLMPPNGVYASKSFFGDQCYPGITNIGYKPTVGERFLGVETYLFGCDEDLYGKFCRIELKAYQRPEQKFESFEALKTQMTSDVEACRSYFDKK